MTRTFSGTVAAAAPTEVAACATAESATTADAPSTATPPAHPIPAPAASSPQVAFLPLTLRTTTSPATAPTAQTIAAAAAAEIVMGSSPNGSARSVGSLKTYA